ncbi:MAG: hypothetical protein BWK72_18205, partial [Rhodoferax ferrireducens]
QSQASLTSKHTDQRGLRLPFCIVTCDRFQPFVLPKHAIQRIAAPYKIEREIKGFSVEDRHAARQSSAKPLCKDLHDWLTHGLISKTC